ncbi:MAG: methionyl-tRNA formyltransferase [Mycoplasma sp.]|nr:methionyl-tRNA formyltransferase [Mycoplasma sp.]
MNKLSKRILFFGTDDVSAIALKALMASTAEIVGVVTKPDKPSGRKKEIIFSPIKEIAIKNNFKLFQPEKLNLSIDEILATKPNLILVCSYGKIIPKQIIDYPEYKCLNIHPSLLPKYRGASPIESAILNCDKITGVSFIVMSPKLDAGDIIDQIEIKIDDNETGNSLREKVKKVIYEYLTNHLNKLFDKDIKLKIQDESKVIFVNQISKEDEKINWNAQAKYIDAKIRALYDKRIAHTLINNLNIKVYAATIDYALYTTKYPYGKIIDINESGLYVATKDNAICIKKIQLPGKKPVDLKQIINGHLPFKKGDIFD